MRLQQRIAWRALWPVRIYLRRFPIHRGKGALTRWLIRPALPKGDASFIATQPSGACLRVCYQEALGLDALLYGGFEIQEQAFVQEHLPEGARVIDVGSNVGLFTVLMALRVGPSGQVIAIEPLEENLRRLRDHITDHGLQNVIVVAAAAGSTSGMVSLNLADDGAYTSTRMVVGRHAIGQTTRVPVARLDSIWKEHGGKQIAIVKIDVEGGEIDVLKGAVELLGTWRPLLLLEANTGPELNEVRLFLNRFGYHYQQPRGFRPWNHVFSPDVASLRCISAVGQ